MKSDNDLRLSCQSALLGAVTPGLVAVSAEIDNKLVRFRCYFDSERAKENEWEVLSCAATEVIADFTNEFNIDEEYLVLKGSKLSHLKCLMYLRCDPSEYSG